MEGDSLFKNVISILVKLLISGVLSIVILSLFTMGYFYSGVHIKSFNGATDYTWESGQFASNMKEGFSWIRFDSNGFNNAYKEKSFDDIDILLMGSSHMEGFNVGSSQNTGYLLNDLLDESTYNIGISGHTIYTCIKNIENAVAVYNPSEYVIIETDKIVLAEEKMREVLSGEYETIKSYDGGLLYTLQKKLPVIKTLYKQITSWKTEKKIDEDIFSYSEEYMGTLEAFLGKAVAPVNSIGDKLIIFYHPTTELDESGKLTNTTNSEALMAFKKACEDNNIIFVDMTDDFERLYEEKSILPYGFINTEVGKGHLNKYGHKVIAEKLAKVISEE